MKTRGQIYGLEASRLLRDVTTYHCVRGAQLVKLYPHKRTEVMMQLLRFLAGQGRIVRKTGTDLYCDSSKQEPDWGMLAALWVLADFAERVEYHTAGEFPSQIVFFADGEQYEILYVSPDREALVEHLTAQSKTDARRIVVVEDTGQIAHLHVPNTAAYCTVTEDGTVRYYQQKQEGCD